MFVDKNNLMFEKLEIWKVVLFLLFSLCILGHTDNVFAGSVPIESYGKTMSLTKGTERDWKPNWSPDGMWITFETIDEIFNNIWMIRRDGKKLTPITSKRQMPEVRVGGIELQTFSYGVHWGLDPTKFMYVSSRNGNYDIWMCEINRGRNLTHKRLTSNKGWDGDPSWSPKGDKLVFVSNRSGNGDLWILDMTANKSEPRQITFNPGIDFSPTWSPDGSHIIFTSKRFNNYEIYSFNIHTDSLKRLTMSKKMERFPSCSPNGKWVAFYSERNISIVPILGGKIRLLASDVKPDSGGPSWSPDSRYIAYIYDKEPMKPIYITDIEDGSTKKIKLPSFLHDSVKWSPDGQSLLFTSFMNGNNDICVAPLKGMRKMYPITKKIVLDKKKPSTVSRVEDIWQNLF